MYARLLKDTLYSRINLHRAACNRPQIYSDVAQRQRRSHDEIKTAAFRNGIVIDSVVKHNK